MVLVPAAVTVTVPDMRPPLADRQLLKVYLKVVRLVGATVMQLPPEAAEARLSGRMVSRSVKAMVATPAGETFNEAGSVFCTVTWGLWEELQANSPSIRAVAAGIRMDMVSPSRDRPSVSTQNAEELSTAAAPFCAHAKTAQTWDLCGLWFGGPSRTRTGDPLIKSQML